jgi:hypothetical protein
MDGLNIWIDEWMVHFAVDGNRLSEIFAGWMIDFLNEWRLIIDW